MRAELTIFAGALRRVFPAAVMDAQAIAFCMFLAFFPAVLFVLGLFALSPGFGSAGERFFSDMRYFMPPESRRAVNDFLILHGTGIAPGAWILLGLGGTLFGGSQVMGGFIQSFRNLYQDKAPAGYWNNQLRALQVLLATFVPLLGAIVLTVFGRELRTWMIAHFGLPRFFFAVWLLVYVGLALISAMLVLSLLYHVGRFGARSWNDVLPGALVATTLWWVVNSAFGYYMRHVPYDLVYAGLTAAIGLLIWMNLCSLIILLGAAYNAETLSRRTEASGPSRAAT